MPITIDATYEDGVLKPASPLPFKEHETVRVTLEPKISLAQQTAGMIPWTGDTETLRRIAEEPEFGHWKPLIECDDQELIEKAALDPELEF